ncbi:hypothetical protein [Aliiglaciecola aliphaticivorans]
MNLYPSLKRKSEKWLLLLPRVRFFGFFGYLSIIISLSLVMFAGSQMVTGDQGDLVVSKTTAEYRGFVWMLSMISFSIGLLCLIISDLRGAVVSIEYKGAQ